MVDLLLRLLPPSTSLLNLVAQFRQWPRMAIFGEI